jgi:hypothetical protein
MTCLAKIAGRIILPNQLTLALASSLIVCDYLTNHIRRRVEVHKVKSVRLMLCHSALQIVSLADVDYLLMVVEYSVNNRKFIPKRVELIKSCVVESHFLSFL